MSRRASLPPLRELNPVPIGVIAVVVLIGLVALALNIGNLPFTSGRGYSAAFSEAAGLRPGDQVEVAGVPVGSVQSVDLEGMHVRVGFDITDGSVHVGPDTHLSIQIATLLGNKYLELDPGGGSTWPADREIPESRTTSPYDVTTALQDLSRTSSQIDSRQLANALNTLAATFRNSPAVLRSTLAGLSRLSETIASRSATLSQLLQRTQAVTGVLADRRGTIATLIDDGSLLLRELDKRRAVIAALLVNTTRLAQQLTGLVGDNQATLHPMLVHLRGVLDALNAHQSELTTIVKGLYTLVRGEVDATGAGPWFDGTAINVVNPVSISGLVDLAKQSGTPGLARLLRLSLRRPAGKAGHAASRASRTATRTAGGGR